jgi:hypothetical protein
MGRPVIKTGKKREPSETALLIPKRKSDHPEETMAQQQIPECTHIVANSTQFGNPVKSGTEISQSFPKLLILNTNLTNWRIALIKP